jgi:CHAT domain-containing protein
MSKFDEADSIYTQFFSIFLTERFHPQSDVYNQFLGDFAFIDMQKDQFQKAVNKYENRSKNILKKFGNQSENYAVALVDLARSEIALGKYSDAEKNLLKADVIFKDQKNTKSRNFAYNLKSLGDVQRINGDFINSSRNLLEGLDLAYKFTNEDPLLSIEIEESLAKLNIELGNYEEASEQLTSAILFKKAVFGSDHPSLIIPQQLLAELHLARGEVISAEKLIRKTMQICSTNLGTNSLAYYQCEEILVHIYHSLGMNNRALDLTNEILEAYQKKVGKKYLRIANLLIIKTKLQYELGYSAADMNSNLNRATQIITYNVNDRHPQIAEVIELKALVFRKENKTQEALIQLQTANLIFTSSYGNTHPKTADNQVNIANLYFETANYTNALAFYSKALSIYEPLLSSMHPKYLYTKSKIGWTFYAQNQLDQAVEILRSTTSSYAQLMRENFPFLSMDEKNKYWEKIWPDFMVFNSLALEYYSTDPTILRDMYDLHLQTKSILFRSEAEINRFVHLYGSPEDLLEDQHLRQLRDSLGFVQSISYFNQKEESLEIQELKENINKIEKKLSESAFMKKSPEFKEIEWTIVRNKLESNEAAMEIMRVEKFLSNAADSITYVALILTKDSKNPEIVVLPNGDDLENRHFNYYQNNLKQNLEDVQSYGWYWEDFEPVLRSRNIIYLSSEGIYSQINPETIKDREGRYLLDRFNFYTVSSTSEIGQLEPYPDYTSKTALLIGNPHFLNATKKFSTTFPPLPGAENEVKEIEKILRKSNYVVDSFIGLDATEKSIKSASNQRILHLATHGYFSDTAATINLQENIGLDIYQKRTNTLQSGLLLAGADTLLRTGSWEAINRGDGMLTTTEAMNLDLSSTELVFLSACETGKTSHHTTEGIGGFQNAFRVAGAKNVIMTLFKVEDQITQEFATNFYQFWMQTGSKRMAFIQAKNAIRKKHSNPFYWGAFIMLGLD